MKKILQYLGLRSSCCNARVITWHQNKFYCEECESWLNASHGDKVINNFVKSPKKTLKT